MSEMNQSEGVSARRPDQPGPGDPDRQGGFNIGLKACCQTSSRLDDLTGLSSRAASTDRSCYYRLAVWLTFATPALSLAAFWFLLPEKQKDAIKV